MKEGEVCSSMAGKNMAQAMRSELASYPSTSPWHDARLHGLAALAQPVKFGMLLGSFAGRSMILRSCWDTLPVVDRF